MRALARSCPATFASVTSRCTSAFGDGSAPLTLARSLTDATVFVPCAMSRRGPYGRGVVSGSQWPCSNRIGGPSAEAARTNEVVVITIPERKVEELPKNLFGGVADDVVVIDTNNYYPRERDGRIEPIEDGMPDSQWVESQIGRPVVKVFNTILHVRIRSLGRPVGDPDRVALPVAGDDERAKAVVMQLVEDCGFDPVDAGSIAESWRQHPGAPVYDVVLQAEGVRRALAVAEPGRPEEMSGTSESPGTYAEPR